MVVKLFTRRNFGALVASFFSGLGLAGIFSSTASGDEQAGRRRGEAEQLGHPADDLAFDFDRRVIASAEIGIETGGQHFRPRRGRERVVADNHAATARGRPLAAFENRARSIPPVTGHKGSIRRISVR